MSSTANDVTCWSSSNELMITSDQLLDQCLHTSHLLMTSQRRCHGNHSSQSEPSAAVGLLASDQLLQPSQYNDLYGFRLTTPESSPGNEKCFPTALATTAVRSPVFSYGVIDEGEFIFILSHRHTQGWKTGHFRSS